MNELFNYLLALPLAFLANVVLGAEVGRRETYLANTTGGNSNIVNELLARIDALET